MATMILANILRGRLDPPLVHLHGPGGSGKTTIAMACAASIAARSSTVAWLDTSRGFSPARFKQVSMGTAGTDASRSLLYTRASTAVALDTAVGTLVDSAPAWHVRLVVLDTAFGCLDIRSEDPAFRRVAWLQARELLGRVAMLSKVHGIPVLLLNTVGTDPRTGTTKPTGADVIAGLGFEDATIEATRDGDRASLRYASCDDRCPFTIQQGGIAPAGGEQAGTPPSRRDRSATAAPGAW